MARHASLIRVRTDGCFCYTCVKSVVAGRASPACRRHPSRLVQTSFLRVHSDRFTTESIFWLRCTCTDVQNRLVGRRNHDQPRRMTTLSTTSPPDGGILRDTSAQGITASGLYPAEHSRPARWPGPIPTTAMYIMITPAIHSVEASIE